MFALESERTGHPAASGVEELKVESKFFEDRLLVGGLHDSLVVTVSMNEGLATQLRRPVALYLSIQKLTQQISLLAQPLGILIAREKRRKFVTKDGHAARLQSHDWDTGLD